ncbi:MAG: nucleoside hydrolase [Promethearchaeota archaeon]
MTPKYENISVIFDTDIDMDCDDAGALAVLHALMDLGEAQILGVIVDVPLEPSARCVMTINNYYNRLDIPVGLLKVNDYETNPKYDLYRKARQWIGQRRDFYTSMVVEQFSNENIKNKKVEDAVSLYRKLLSKVEKNSVIIIAVGLLSALGELIKSEPDKYSRLNGLELVRKKVKKLITMGIGYFPEANAEFNWRMDWESARYVIQHWPTPLVVQSNGKEFLTGNTLSIKTPDSNPVRKCYEVYLRGPRIGNFSWDPITALYGVRGSEPFLDEKFGYRLLLDEEHGKNHWIPDEKDEYHHSFLQLRNPKIKIKQVIEKLITKPPKK